MIRIISTLFLLILFTPSSFPAQQFWNRGHGYLPFHHATPEGILLSNDNDVPLIDTITFGSSQDVTLSFRIDNRHAHPARRYEFKGETGERHHRINPPWGILLTDTEGNNCWITVSNEEKEDPVSSKASTKVEISFNNKPVPSGEKYLNSNELPFAGESLWKIQFKNGYLKIIAGGNSPAQILNIPVDIRDISTFGFIVSPGGEILVSDVSLLTSDSSISFPEMYDVASLKDSLSKPDDPLEGYWDIFDRTLEESLLKLGGDYRLGILKEEDHYVIIYLEGARVNSSLWKSGMIKGYLRPTSFPGLFNLEWKDAEGNILSHSITAQLEKEDLLVLQFPYHSSTIRLRRVSALAD